MRANRFQRLSTDRTTLIIFTALVVLSSVIAFVSYFVSIESSTPGQLLGALLSGITVSFFICGILSYLRNRDASLIPRRIITIWALKASLVIALVVTAIAIVAILTSVPGVDVEPFTSIGGTAVLTVVVFVSLFVGMFFAVLFGEIAAFGVVGVMAAIERRIAPRVLAAIGNLGDKAKLSFAEMVIRWFFAIPDIVDTRLLDVHPSSKRMFVKWRDMFHPLEWELLFGAVLALYISLNPFVAEGGISASAVFSLMTNGAVLIPFVILPWFAFQRLGAGIGGAKKEFTLFNGIRSRLLQTFFAVGTLLLVARVLISETDILGFAIGFIGFMFSLLLVSLLCTFVYLNFFENDLVEDIATSFEESTLGPQSTEMKSISDMKLGGKP